MSVIEEYRLVGTGKAVYEDDQPVEGPVVWLDTPQAVIDFVAGGRAGETIVVARGGTTTFLTPALTAGVKGVITLQGAPESHLGILSREYGIPCVMSVQFEDGVRSDRGEVIPADGAIVRLDVREREGRVYVEPGAPSLGERPAPTDEEQAMAAKMEQVAVLLEHYRGEVPHGGEGDAQMRTRLGSGVLELAPESLGRDLTAREVNDLQDYMGWNLWDYLAARATEGESGLIPRQEYEAFGCVQQWQRYAGFFRRITEEIGADGVVDLGRTARREVGTKINMLHVWCSGFTPMFGRGVLLNLGVAKPDERTRDVKDVLQFMRRLYAGLWDGGPMFTTMRDYRAPLLADDLLGRFREELVELDDPDRRRFYQRFSASTELMGFLLHFDNRSGLNDSGPYPLPDGRFMVVRDHFLRDAIYHWHDVAEDLPHAITQAMVFDPDVPMATRMMDGGNLFTEPANYMKHLAGMALYVRDEWDSEVRPLGEEEMQRILDVCEGASNRLYRRIAAMPPRDKVMAGGTVYYAEFVAPFARAAGVWDELVTQHDFFEVDPVASDVYYTLVKDGVAAELVPQQFLMGTAYQHVPDDEEAADAHAAAFDLLHRVALRGSHPLGDEHAPLVAAGLLGVAGAGDAATVLVSERGARVHDVLLARERAGLDGDRLASIYERFLAVNGELKAAASRWHDAGPEDRVGLLESIGTAVERVGPGLRRAGELVPRFADYAPRLDAALRRARGGEHEWLTGAAIDSVHTVWMEVHEDYLQVLGRSREEEGSY